MILKENYGYEHIKSLKEQTGANEDIIEKSLFAFGLLEAITMSGLSFVFKGGSCLMLLLKEPKRFSTDIDIIVKPGTDIDDFIEKAGHIFPFFHHEEQFRKAKGNIEKRHFKFIYLSPVRDSEVSILLDVLFEDYKYSSTMTKPITNDLVLSDAQDVEVQIPGINCILGDKLTAFAPHTTGIRIDEQKELEIIKQLFDCATLLREMTDFNEVKETYMNIVKTEMEYRELTVSVDDVLFDTIRSATCIVGRGSLYKSPDYEVYAKGVRAIGSHLLTKKYDMTTAGLDACQVMYLASCILSNKNEFSLLSDYESYRGERILQDEFKSLTSIKKVSIEDYAYLIETFRNLP